MDRSLRILVASPLGRIVAPAIKSELPAATVDLAENSDAVCTRPTGSPR